MGEDVGRAGGVFRATAGLRDRFGADRCVDTPLAEAGILGTAVGLCMAGWRPVVRDAVRRVLLPVPRPADQPRRPLPLAHARGDGVPARRADAVRRRRAGARAARRLARGVLRAHARREGGDSLDAGRREGAAGGGDPRSRPGRRARAEARLPDGARRGAGGRARRARSGKMRVAREGDRPHARRLRGDGAGRGAGGRRARRVGRGARRAHARSRSTRRRCSRRSRRPAAS